MVQHTEERQADEQSEQQNDQTSPEYKFQYFVFAAKMVDERFMQFFSIRGPPLLSGSIIILCSRYYGHTIGNHNNIMVIEYHENRRTGG